MAYSFNNGPRSSFVPDRGGPLNNDSYQSLLLALSNLGSHVNDAASMPVACECTLRFLRHEHPAVRRQAALATIRILQPRSASTIKVCSHYFIIF